MDDSESEKNKQVIGLYGEMQLAMALHERGWQVHRAYIDEGIDFAITKYWCPECKKFSNQYIRFDEYGGKNAKCVTNLCEHCNKTELNVVSKYLQIKTSEGIKTKDNDIKDFSFHPKIRYDMGSNVFYVWIAVISKIKEDDIHSKVNDKICYFYIFNTKDVSKFDNVSIDTYQITDNQKTTLKINSDGRVLNKGKKYNYDCFNNEFYNNFESLEAVL